MKNFQRNNTFHFVSIYNGNFQFCLCYNQVSLLLNLQTIKTHIFITVTLSLEEICGIYLQNYFIFMFTSIHWICSRYQNFKLDSFFLFIFFVTGHNILMKKLVKVQLFWRGNCICYTNFFGCRILMPFLEKNDLVEQSYIY